MLRFGFLLDMFARIADNRRSNGFFIFRVAVFDVTGADEVRDQSIRAGANQRLGQDALKKENYRN